MNHTEVLNALIDAFGYESYLEIGVENPEQNFDLIECDDKEGVDIEEVPEPKKGIIQHYSSDRHFGVLPQGFSYDLVFIDGDHTADQVYKDIVNSLKYLREGGTIVVHDVNPTTELMQITPRDASAWDAWTGDGWKAWRSFMVEKEKFFTIDSDFGIGVYHNPTIKEGPFWEWDNILKNTPYAMLAANRERFLNLISVDEFEQWLITHKTTKSELS